MLQPIESLEDTCSGRIYLVCNGPSARDFDFSNKPICGINRAYQLGRVDFTVALDPPTIIETAFWNNDWIMIPESKSGLMKEDIKHTPIPLIWGDDWFFGHKPPFFSGFTLYTALQICNWMGYEEFVVVGWDLEVGSHMSPYRTFTNEAFLRQVRGAHHLAESGLDIRVVGDKRHPLTGILPLA